MDDKKFKKLFTESFVETVIPEIDKLNKRVDQLEEKVEKRNDDVFTKMDAVYKEVLSIRDEQTMHTGSHTRVDEKLEEHEKRIKKLESKSVTA